ncbi:Crp/Fnr family transcriptional regulator [Vibrio sp. HN007]|uniref:Crp/Fnr family transcriptional regulator n=1 Tax=Vibrio iocasae TaxID=3098914 RepID=UPI0035D5159C
MDTRYDPYESFSLLLSEDLYPVLYKSFMTTPHRKTYKAGEQIVFQNVELDKMGFILSGEAEIEIVSDDGDLLIPEKFSSNSLINAVAFIDGGISPAAVVAVTDCTVLFIPYSRLRADVELCREATLIAGLCAASLYRIAERLLSTALLLPLNERVLQRLERLKDEGNQVSITAEKLASYLAVSKHRVHRVLKNLEEEGLIINAYGSVQLVDK